METRGCGRSNSETGQRRIQRVEMKSIGKSGQRPGERQTCNRTFEADADVGTTLLTRMDPPFDSGLFLDTFGSTGARMERHYPVCSSQLGEFSTRRRCPMALDMIAWHDRTSADHQTQYNNARAAGCSTV